MSTKFFHSPGGEGNKKRKKLQKLRSRKRPDDSEEPGEKEASFSPPPPPSEGDLIFKTALNQHETEELSFVQDQHYDYVDDDDDNDNDNDDDDDNNENNDNNEDEDTEDQDQDQDQDKDDSEERLAKFRLIVVAFEDHMKSREGGEKPIDDVKLAAKRLWLLLDGTHLRRHNQLLESTEVAVHAWILALIETEFTHISKYLDDLALRRGLQPNTIKAYLTSSFIPFFIWYRLFSLVAPQPSPDAHARLQLILKSLVANYRKLAKVTKRVETRTVEELIAGKQWPPGGMPELQAAYLQNLPHILCAFGEGVETYRHNDEFFRAFMELMMFGKILQTIIIILVIIISSHHPLHMASFRLLRIRPSGTPRWHK